jgi:glycerol-3-phosphate dehydrogenase (NAD(P)+)
MTRLGIALGAQRETFMGLAGLGDLVLTCTDDQSRNRRFGKLLAKGTDVTQALKEIGQVVEGYMAAKAVYRVAQHQQVEMPICEGIYQMLHENLPPQEVVRGLMSRPIRPEFD